MVVGRVGTKREAGSACVVGVGASAGGLEPMRTLIDALPADCPAAVVIVQHRDPTGEDHLGELLADRSNLPVREVVDGQRIRAGAVHVVPGRALVELGEDGVFRFQPNSEGDPHAPIDFFFESLASSFGSRAIGVVLSGAGGDGSVGLRTIAEHGGSVMVQSPDTARWSDMPEHARSVGAADHVLPPAELAGEIDRAARYLAERSRDDGESDLREGVRASLEAVIELLLEEVGHDFRYYKASTLERRVERRMQVLRIPTADAYLERLRGDPDEPPILFRQLLIGVTQFFRDPEAFEALAREVYPAMFADRSSGRPVRAWVVGCATGEEAYSLAIALREHADTLEHPPPIQIFATDVDEHALGVARKGSYPARIEEHVSPERLERFFVKRGKRWKVKKSLRERIAFSVHDVTADPPFSRQDLISCRNVLIYLGPTLQKKLVPVFHNALSPGGHLLLGPSESISHHRELFRTVDQKHRIWQRRKSTAGRASATSPLSRVRSRSFARDPVESLDDPDLLLLLQRVVLDELAPKAAVVDEEGQLLCVSGDMSRFMSVSAGAFRNEIARLVRSDLRVGLRAALNEARKTGEAVVREDLALRGDDGAEPVRLTVRPMAQPGSDERLFTVVFETLAAAARPGRAGAEHGDDASAVIEQLERELEVTRDDLERSVQDLEATNEELKASNEELLSMNEELQSSNEELETSKEEVQSANEALGRAHDDLNNLLRAAEIATLFLDGDRRVRGFTPAVGDFYHLIEGDVGRPLHHITPKLDAMPPLPDLDAIAAEGVEERFRNGDGRCFLRRVLIYRTSDGVADGMVVTFVDITELEAARTELSRSLAQLEAVYAAAPVGLGVLDRDLRFVRVNDRLAAIYDLAPEEHVGRRLDEILDSDLARFKAEAASRVLSGHTIQELEISGQTRAAPGEERRWMVSLTPVSGPADEVIGMSIVVRDVTEERAAELERRRLTTLVERSTEFIGVARQLDGTGVYLNPAGRALVGLTGDVADTRIQDHVAPEDHGLLREAVETAVRDGRSRAELRFRHRDGTLIPVLYDVFRIDDPITGRPDTVGTVTKDLREMQRVESELIESRNRLMSLAHGLPNIVWRADADGKLSWVSHRWRELTGLDDETTLSGGGEAAFHPDDLGRVRTEWARHVESGEPLIVELRLKVRNGEHCWFLARAVPVRAGDGRVIEWIGSFTDINSLKQLQAQLEAADHRKNEFLAMLGHELRNPLAPILSAADLLTREDAFDHPDEARGAAAAIERQAWHLARMVDDLLDVARLSRGRITLRLQTVDLRDQVRAAVEANEGLLRSRGHHLELHLPEKPIRCRVDPTRVTQIISNLVNNAAKYAGDGAHVSVGLSVESQKARVAVADDGPGIETDVLPRLFEPFTQAARTLDRAEGGLGLGLSLSKGLADLHGGTLEVDSERGAGATFVLMLPTDSERSDSPSRRAPSPGNGAPKRILVVDDNEDAAAMLSIRLQRDGHDVQIASAGPEALELAQREGFDIMLLDIGLPGMSGYELARELRGREDVVGRPRLIALTGYGAPGDRARSEEAGFEAHLLKPVDLEVLRRTIARAPDGS